MSRKRILDGFDDNRAVWLAGKPAYVASEPLRGDISVDVAIIGGGFTGVSTAYHVSDTWPEKTVALFEARTLGNGASGRNGGQMLNWVHGIETNAPKQAKRIYDVTREAIDSIVSLIQEHALAVPYRRDGHLDVFTSPEAADAGEREVGILRSFGLPIRFLDRASLQSEIDLVGATGGIFDPEAGQLDGIAYLRALKPVLVNRGVQIFENTPIHRWHAGDRHRLQTAEGEVRASQLVLATNAYAPKLKPSGIRDTFRAGLFPLHSHVIATEAHSPEHWAARGWKRIGSFTDDRDRLSYGTLTASGRLLFGGGSNQSYQYVYNNGTALKQTQENASKACRDQLLAYLPRMSDTEIAYEWSGPVALTLSRICAMGVADEARSVFYALGYSGHGVTLANLAGRVLRDLMAGETERWDALPFYEQRLAYIPPEPFRWLGYQAYTRLTGRSPKKQ